MAATSEAAPKITPPDCGCAGLAAPPVIGKATAYGADYNGQPLGCPGYGVYKSYNPRIAAVGPARYEEWPCGTKLELCHYDSTGSSCIVVERMDACPGCPANWVDLSEAGNIQVCGTVKYPYPHTCSVTIRRLGN